jgi:predicted transcriptional regulator
MLGSKIEQYNQGINMRIFKLSQSDTESESEDPDQPFITPQDLLDSVMEADLLLVLVAQYSGVFNMFTDAQQVCEIANISGRNYKNILKNYSRLVEMHPELSEKARRITSTSMPKDNTTLEKMLWIKRLINKTRKLQA